MPDRSRARLLAGRYEVLEILGQGGMGEVRVGRDLRLQREVAIKLLRADLARDPTIRARFENEAQMAARLVHPNVVSVFDAAEDGGIPFLVMERLSGQTLADVIAGGPLSVPDVGDLGCQILAALGAAHASGLIHRDVKPRNIMAAGPGCWKVGDFGIAKSLEPAEQDLTKTGLIVGTPRYLAPERLAGGPATISGDLYGAGVVLYEALTARRLFESVTPSALLTAIPQPVTELRPDIPAGVAAVVMRAFARDPSARFSTAAQMADALRSSSVAFAPTVVWDPIQERLLDPTEVMSPSERPHRRHVLALAGASIAVLLVLVLVVLASGGRGISRTPAVTSTTQTTVQHATTTVPPPAPTVVVTSAVPLKPGPPPPAGPHGHGKGKR